MNIALVALLALLIVPFYHASANVTDTPSSLAVSLASETPYVYQDSDGHTVVVGSVNNNAQTSVTNVMIQVIFYDELGTDPVEITSGRTVLEVIPPEGESPFAIRSETPNPSITEASVSLLGFDPASDKLGGLMVYSSEVLYDGGLIFSGILQNSGAPSNNTTVHMAMYDGFDPPRILEVVSVELGDVAPSQKVPFDATHDIDPRSVGFLMFAESDAFSSSFVDIEIPKPAVLTKMVSIEGVSVTGSDGDRLSEIPIGTIVNVRSELRIELVADQKTNETPYTYHVQIKRSDNNQVEHLESDNGRFIGTGLQHATIDWMPQNGGLYYIETFVWDRSNVPIANQGPFVLIHVK